MVLALDVTSDDSINVIAKAFNGQRVVISSRSGIIHQTRSAGAYL